MRNIPYDKEIRDLVKDYFLMTENRERAEREGWGADTVFSIALDCDLMRGQLREAEVTI